MRKSLKNSCVLILNWDLGEREQSRVGIWKTVSAGLEVIQRLHVGFV